MFSSNLLLFLKEFDAEGLYDDFIEHFKYGTADIYYENNKIVGAVRYNISDSGKTAYILDLFILDGFNGSKIMRYFGFRGKKKFPLLEYIKFKRERKFTEDKARVHKLSSLIRG